jgi:hypothetical protein
VCTRDPPIYASNIPGMTSVCPTHAACLLEMGITNFLPRLNLNYNLSWPTEYLVFLLDFLFPFVTV